MKKNLLCIFAIVTACVTDGFSQARTHFYNKNMVLPSVVAVPGTGEYLVSETRSNGITPSGFDQNNAIHITHYNAGGNVVGEITIDDVIADNRSVSLDHINNDVYLLTSLYQEYIPVGTTVDYNAIQFVVFNLSGAILDRRIIRNADVPYHSDLIPLDAVVDKQRGQIVVCGFAPITQGTSTACVDGCPAVNIPKDAFVATFDMNLNPIRMKYFESGPYPLWSAEDWDIATKIIIDPTTSNYYIAGSVNDYTAGSTGSQAIRNMLLNPNTLNPIWDVPLKLGLPNTRQGSVDLYDNPQNGEHILLVNAASFTPGDIFTTHKWYLIRINIATGLYLYSNAETISLSTSGNPIQYGYRLFQESEGGSRIILAGLKPGLLNRQCNTMNSNMWIVPFLCRIDIASYPATISQHTEYNTLFGHNYWLDFLGGVYAINGSVSGVPTYTNSFIDRAAIGSNFGIFTPIKNNINLINQKFLSVDASLKNGCDDIKCDHSINRNTTIAKPNIPVDAYDGNLVETESLIEPYPYTYYSIRDCSDASPYYKTAPLGVGEIQQTEMTVAPNPATDHITIDIQNNPNGTVQLLDMTGKIIYSVQTTAPKTIIDMKPYASGIYMIKYFADPAKAQVKRIQKLQ